MRRLDTLTDIEFKKEIETHSVKNILPSKETIEKAEMIKYRSSPSIIPNTDEFGFEKENNSVSQEEDEEFSEYQKKRYNIEVEKWYSIYIQIRNKSVSVLKKNKDLKNKTRQGIPDCLRDIIWRKFAETDSFYKKGLYQQLKNEEFQTQKGIRAQDTLFKDLSRTFPDNILFRNNYGEGQRAMYYVLSSYAKYNKKTTYVQGMGFICALLLIYMTPENAFFTMDSLMKKYGLENLYEEGFPKLKAYFFCLSCLIKKHMKEVFDILKKNEVYISMFASEWFLTLFSRVIPFKVLVRIFDVFFLEGFKTMFRFALGFLKLKEKQIIQNKNNFSETIRIVKDFDEEVNINELFKVSFNFKISTKEILDYEKKYNALLNSNPNDPRVNML